MPRVRGMTVFVSILVAVTALAPAGRAQAPARRNPVIRLLEQNKPVFGVYTHGNRLGGRGRAPAHWGMSDKEYRSKADLWPLNPEGELINWTIVESKEGLAHVREIAQVKGIGVLWPGAGTLRGVFSSTNAAGERVFDAAGWENAIQTVLTACKEFNVPCGFPATPNDIEIPMKQDFRVFVMTWGDAGFKAVDLGRAASGR